MSTFLFDSLIFGPIRSRRLGISLGINLLPTDSKSCNFSCIYCECGYTPEYNPNVKTEYPSVEQYKNELENRLAQMNERGQMIDAITFAGNGEPTLHPEFVNIIEITKELRNKYFPTAKISVLTNATNIHKPHIFEALTSIENPILKLDSGIDETVKILNHPPQNYTIEKMTQNFLKFNGNFILQTMFVKGVYNGKTIDNTTNEEVEKWLEVVKIIKPRLVMIYTIERATPVENLEKVSIEKLNEIGELLQKEGIEVQISG